METGWKERTLARSLGPARDRAVSRSARFISAATTLLHETGNLDFTVAELVGRSGLSLRSFYQHFAGKDDLLLAVLEEAIRGFVDDLRLAVEPLVDPLEQLRRYVTAFYAAGESPDRRASAALSRYLLTLTSQSSGEVARVLAPQVQLLAQIMSEGVDTGSFRDDISVSSLTILVTQTLMSAVETNVLGTEVAGQSISAEDLWRFCRSAVTRPA